MISYAISNATGIQFDVPQLQRALAFYLGTRKGIQFVIHVVEDKDSGRAPVAWLTTGRRLTKAKEERTTVKEMVQYAENTHTIEAAMENLHL